LLLHAGVGHATELHLQRAMLVNDTTILEDTSRWYGVPSSLSATCTAVPLGCSVQVPPSTGACSGHAAVTKSNNITYYFRDVGTGQPIPNCPIVADYRPEQSTGGHCHTDSNRPVEYPAGAVPRVISGNTGADGLQFVVPNTWPEESGAIDVRVYGTDPGCPYYYDTTTVTFVLCIRVAQFSELGADTSYDLTGTKPEHPSPNNHYGTAKLLAVLPLLAQDFLQAYPGVKLGYNDMSLPWGGVFDLDQNWHAPHCGHRVGTSVDVRTKNLNKTQRNKLQALLKKRGFGIYFHTDHWHCTLRG
jgi:hypothetical protein